MSASDAPRAKRLRVESSAREPIPLVLRSEIWFDDGSIVLQAEMMQFRVHRSVISRHSPIFMDLFAIAHPADEAMVDGCPVVHLPDSAEDIKHLLMALYDKSYNIREVLPFPVVRAILRLGRKYEIDHLRDEAVLRLTTEFPTTLKEWDALPPEYTHIKDQPGILFDIINLAREHSINSILPTAYYLSLRDMETAMRGDLREDGTTAALSPDVQTLLVLGRDRILDALGDTTLAWLDTEEITLQCTNKSQCSRVRIQLLRSIWRLRPDYAHALEKWEDLGVHNMCRACTTTAKELHDIGRVRMWDLLPSFFSLPGWQGLHNLDS